jgi:hypothetical protein
MHIISHLRLPLAAAATAILSIRYSRCSPRAVAACHHAETSTTAAAKEALPLLLLLLAALLLLLLLLVLLLVGHSYEVHALLLC